MITWLVAISSLLHTFSSAAKIVQLDSMVKATKTLKEMQDTLEEEKREMQVVLWLVIFVVIGLVGVGLFATWQYCCKGGASADLEAHQKPRVEKK